MTKRKTQMTKKKHYTKPVLAIIDLDPEQAIITQCRIGGLWMQIGQDNCVHVGTHRFNCCHQTARGFRDNRVSAADDLNLAPS